MSVTPHGASDERAPVVLYVEDDEDTRQLVHRWLRQAGAVTIAVGSALAALEFCRASLPSVILTDLQMPYMDGEAFIRELHRELGERMPPVLILTGARPLGWHPTAPGVVGVLHKPAERGEVLEKVKSCLASCAPLTRTRPGC